MTAEGKTTTKGMQVGDIVLLEPCRIDDTKLIPAARKGAAASPYRVESITAVKAPAPGRRTRMRYEVALTQMHGEPGDHDDVTLNVSGSQTWWLATASTHWRNHLAVAPPR